MKVLIASNDEGAGYTFYGMLCFIVQTSGYKLWVDNVC